MLSSLITVSDSIPRLKEKRDINLNDFIKKNLSVINVLNSRKSTSYITTFYNKKIYDTKNTILRDSTSSLVIFLFGGFAKLFTHTQNWEVKHLEKFESLNTKKKRNNIGLLTYSNHFSSIDDPVGTLSLVPYSYLLQKTHLRWVLAAEGLLFKNVFLDLFFSGGKGIPIKRGGGLDQPGMDNSISKLSRGDWLHIFPGGKLSVNQEINPVKPGIAKMIIESNPTPIIQPLYFQNCFKVMKIKQRIPNFGQNVTVIIGDPVDVDEIKYNNQLTEKEKYQQITQILEEKIKELKKKLEDEQKNEQSNNDLNDSID
eukprot:TRINITY_DN1238_c4_g1_i1.p1 TRINITY_DN1238_c4_g1~~TRINITY_DN1238_c4_g1_i1.p1  ORF type:complete len:313 (+),score=92.42 TRINITY_DN1238_c4_g1_i1:32-970(+)